jgi:hypothetical protein
MSAPEQDMKPGFGVRIGRLAVGAVLLSLALAACSGKNPVSPASFVGKWKSSKLETPVILYDNGEWEIKTDTGGILQYGVWEYRDGRIVWSFKIDGKIGHDANRVISVSDKEFRLQEGNQVTVFKRLD